MSNNEIGLFKDFSSIHFPPLMVLSSTFLVQNGDVTVCDPDLSAVLAITQLIDYYDYCDFCNVNFSDKDFSSLGATFSLEQLRYSVDGCFDDRFVQFKCNNSFFFYLS